MSDELTGWWCTNGRGRIGKVAGRHPQQPQLWVGKGLDGEVWASIAPQILSDHEQAWLNTNAV